MANAPHMQMVPVRQDPQLFTTALHAKEYEKARTFTNGRLYPVDH